MIKRNLIVFYTLTIILLSIYFNSRSFLIASLVASIYLLITANVFQPKLIIKLVAFIFPIVIAFLLTIFYKSDSTKGRILIYKISTCILRDHFLGGVGLNKFPGIYMNYQANYFRSGNYSMKELLLAGDARFVFNDYYQLILELGLTGVFLDTLYFLVVYLSVNFYRKKKTSIFIHQMLIFNIISISVAAFFTHVFENALFQLVLIFSFGYLWKDIFKISLLKFFSIMIPALCIFAFYNYGKYLIYYSEYKKAGEVKILFKQGFYEEAVASYKEIYPVLRNDEDFLYYYSQALLYSYNIIEAEKIFKQLIKIRDCSIYERKLAECYLDQKRFSDAETTLVKSINMVPNRFSPRFDLFNLYLKTQQYNKAYICGQTILKLPVKVPSPIVYSIKKRTRESLIYYNIK